MHALSRADLGMGTHSLFRYSGVCSHLRFLMRWPVTTLPSRDLRARSRATMAPIPSSRIGLPGAVESLPAGGDALDDTVASVKPCEVARNLSRRDLSLFMHEGAGLERQAWSQQSETTTTTM